MFNFLSVESLGEYLAPMTGANKLFLAIQHHRNSEIQSQMSLNSYDMNEKLLLTEGGYGAVHCAAKYNNQYALVLILNKGINVDFSDDVGNTPLHYAAKYGSVDCCKILLERNACVLRKNRQQQTPYDVADGMDVVRQYLLPLYLNAERALQTGEVSGSSSVSTQQYVTNGAAAVMQSVAGALGGGGPGLPTISSMPPPNPMSVPSQQVPAANNFPYGQAPPSYGQPPSMAVAPPTIGASAQPPQYGAYNSNIAASGPPPMPTYAPGVVPTYGMQAPPGSAGKQFKQFKPDGFHTSASDPVLQARYGHTKEIVTTAPPPTGAMGGGSMPPPASQMLSQGGAPPSSIYNRYVPYDAHNNTAAPIPQMGGGPGAPPPFGVPSSGSGSGPPPQIMQVINPSAPHPAQAQTQAAAPSPWAAAKPRTLSPDVLATSSSSSSNNNNLALSRSNSNSSSSLLGNKNVPSLENMLTPSIAPAAVSVNVRSAAAAPAVVVAPPAPAANPMPPPMHPSYYSSQPSLQKLVVVSPIETQSNHSSFSSLSSAGSTTPGGLNPSEQQQQQQQQQLSDAGPTSATLVNLYSASVDLVASEEVIDMSASSSSVL